MVPGGAEAGGGLWGVTECVNGEFLPFGGSNSGPLSQVTWVNWNAVELHLTSIFLKTLLLLSAFLFPE